MALAASVPGLARAENADVRFTVGQPSGFAALADEQELLVDVYFGGVYRGDLRIHASPGRVSVTDPDQLRLLLPPLQDGQAVLASLLDPGLPSHANLACGSLSERSTCGGLAPEIAGVILDRDKLRLDVFINPRFLSMPADAGPALLPVPDRAITAVNTIAGVVSGQTDGPALFSLQNNLIVGSGERRLRANLGYTDGHGLDVETLALEWDRPGLRYLAGALWAPGSDAIQRRKIVGAGIQSQIDTRADRETLIGSPLVVSLDRRARVDVLRDGQLLHSAIYEAGNRLIDTSALPDGAYEVILRIEEPGGVARDQRQFFSKNRRTPSMGRTDFYAFAGLRTDDPRGYSIEPSGNPYLQGGIAHRLAQAWALDAALEADDEGGSVLFGGTWLAPGVQVRAAAMVDTGGDIGGLVQVSSAGVSRLNFNFDLRRMPEAARPAGPGPAGTTAAGSYRQASGSISYAFDKVRFFGTAFYRDEDSGRSQYSIGPSLEWDVLRKGAVTLTLRGDATITGKRTAGFAGAIVRFQGARRSLTALGGVRRSSRDDASAVSGAVASLGGAWTTEAGAGLLQLGAGLELQPGQDSVLASADYRHPLGSIAGDLVRTKDARGAASQFTAGFRTTLAARGGNVELAGKTTAESLFVAKVTGVDRAQRFELLVDGQVAARLAGGETVPVALPSYRAYEVRIRAAGPGLVSYDPAPRTVSLYPGTVASLEWTSAPIQVQFGRLLDRNGLPLAHASLRGPSTWAETDKNGFFEIETEAGAHVTVTDRLGRTFALVLPVRTGEIVRLGDLECCGDSPVQLGFREEAHTTTLPEKRR